MSLLQYTPSCTRKQGYKLSFSQRPLRSARQMPSCFFFLECGRCRAKARSLHEHKQETHLYKGKSSPLRRQIDYNWTQTKNTGQPNTTTRKSPSQTCVSPEETAKQTAKQQTKTKNGARAQTKTPTKSICHGTQWLVHCIIIKNVPMN